MASDLDPWLDVDSVWWWSSKKGKEADGYSSPLQIPHSPEIFWIYNRTRQAYVRDAEGMMPEADESRQ